MLRTIGILVDRRLFNNIKSGKTGQERLSLYNRAAKQLGLVPIYLCLDHIKQASRTSLSYKYVNGRYKYGQFPIPAVIHNRSMISSASQQRRFNTLKKKSYVFNGQNRYSKLYIYQLLKKSFSNHLPRTVRYTKGNLHMMMGQHSSLHIKPQSSSVGKGIMQLLRSDGRWRVRLPGKSVTRSKNQAVQMIHQRASKKKYLIQETIPLAKYHGNKYDVRVTVQRNSQGVWQVTGMMGKVANKGHYVTNVARGGRAKKVNDLFASSFSVPSHITYAVKQLSLQIARFLGQRLNHLSDIGLDIGIDAAGKPYFIEMNGRDQRYGFKILKMSNTFYNTYYTPIAYGAYLLNKRK